MLVHQVKEPGDALIVTVGEESVGFGRSGTPFSMGSGIAPLAPEIGLAAASNMSEKLTANRAPFGQKADPTRSGSLPACVAASAEPVRLAVPEATASMAVAPMVCRSRDDWVRRTHPKNAPWLPSGQ